MADYKRVSEALEEGAEPAILCATCPWDRFCVSPPSMTAADVKAAMDKASADDKVAVEKAKAEGREPGMPFGTLLTAVTVGGRDTQAQICPVLALRLRSGSGDGIVAVLKKTMKSWDDNAVTE